MSTQEQLSKDLLLHELIQNQQEARFKPWEMPVTQFGGLQISLPQLVPRSRSTPLRTTTITSSG